MRSQAVGVEGFTLPATGPVLEALRQLDGAGPERSALIHVGDPRWSLEIRRQRWLVTEAWLKEFADSGQEPELVAPEGAGE